MVGRDHMGVGDEVAVRTDEEACPYVNDLVAFRRVARGLEIFCQVRNHVADDIAYKVLLIVFDFVQADSCGLYEFERTVHDPLPVEGVFGEHRNAHSCFAFSDD